MKRVRKPVTAATSITPMWYRLTKDDILKGSRWGDNIWFQYIIETFPLDEALNMRSLDGSKVIDGNLYYLDSTEITVTIDGQEVDIAEALDLFEVEDLGALVGEDKSKAQSITSMDIAWDILEVNKVARLLLRDNDLAQVAVDAEDVGLITLG